MTRTSLPGASALLAVLALAGCRDAPSAPPGPDTTAPSVSLAADRPGAETTDATLRVEGVVTDQVGVQRVSYVLNGVSHDLTIRPGKRVVLRFDVQGLRGGPNQLVVLAEDAARNRGSADRIVRLVPVRRSRPYAVTQLGQAGGSTLGHVDINESGEVVADYRTPSLAYTGAFRWKDGRRTELRPLPGGDAAHAVAISDGGRVLGFSRSAAGSRMVTWDGDAPTDLSAACPEMSGRDLNDAGDVVGHQFPTHGARICRGGKVSGLSQPSIGPDYVYAVNARGQAVGYVLVSYGQATLWDGARTVYLGYGRHSRAVAISDSGHVAGMGGLFGTVPYLWKDGRFTDLEQTVGAGGVVYDVNSRGEVLGVYHVGGRPRLFVWRDGVPYEVAPADTAWSIEPPADSDLPFPAAAFNDAGQVVAWGRNTRTGAAGPVLLTPLP